MDSLTQIVLGAAVGEVVLGKKIGNKAILWGAVAGTIPDLDVLARYMTDTITATAIHRGFSHSIVFAVVISPLLGILLNRLYKHLEVGWKGWTSLFFWGIFTHPLLDIFTTWGTQLFWPFENRLAFNSIFVIDPLYTLPFLICVILAMMKKRGSLSRKRINQTGIIISTTYLLLTLFLKWAAHTKFVSALEKQQIDYSALSTRPSAMNTILWNANVDAGDYYLIGDYSFFDTKPIEFKRFQKNREEFKEVINKEEVQQLIDISQGWFIIERTGNDLIYNDLRFGLLPINSKESQFVFRYILTSRNGQIVATENRPEPESMAMVLNQLWNRITGN